MSKDLLLESVTLQIGQQRVVVKHQQEKGSVYFELCSRNDLVAKYRLSITLFRDTTDVNGYAVKGLDTALVVFRDLDIVRNKATDELSYQVHNTYTTEWASGSVDIVQLGLADGSVISKGTNVKQPASSFSVTVTGIEITVGDQLFEFKREEIETGYVPNTQVIAHQVLVVLKNDKKDTKGETLKGFVEDLHISRDVWFKPNYQAGTIDSSVIEGYTTPFVPATIEVTNINVTFNYTRNPS